MRSRGWMVLLPIGIASILAGFTHGSSLRAATEDPPGLDAQSQQTDTATPTPVVSPGMPPDDAGRPPGAGRDKELTSDREIDPRIATQLPLADASSQIQQLSREKGLPNFAGVRLDNDRGTVVLYWKGPLPPEMADLVAGLRVNIPIEVVASPYSLTEFQQEARRLVELAPAATGVNVTQAGPLPDFSGLRVAVESAEQLDRARQVIQSPIRLEFAVAPKSQPLYYRRDSWVSLSLGLGVVAALALGVWTVVTRTRRR